MKSLLKLTVFIVLYVPSYYAGLIQRVFEWSERDDEQIIVERRLNQWVNRI